MTRPVREELFVKDNLGRILYDGPFPKLLPFGVNTVFALWELRAAIQAATEAGTDAMSPFSIYQSRRIQEVLAKPITEIRSVEAEEIPYYLHVLRAHEPRCRPPVKSARSWTGEDQYQVAGLYLHDHDAHRTSRGIYHCHWQTITDVEYCALLQERAEIVFKSRSSYVDTDTVISQPTQEKPMATSFVPTSTASITRDLIHIPSASALVEATKGAFERAAWGTAAAKVSETLRDTMVAKLSSSSDPSRLAVAAFLSTDEGLAVVSAIAGYAVLFSPQLQADPRVGRLGTELREHAASRVTFALADMVFDPIIAAFTAAVAGLPKIEEEAPEEAKP